jgi:hypothetical protein
MPLTPCARCPLSPQPASNRNPAAARACDARACLARVLSQVETGEGVCAVAVRAELAVGRHRVEQVVDALVAARGHGGVARREARARARAEGGRHGGEGGQGDGRS